MNVLATLERLLPWRTKSLAPAQAGANPAGEGNWHPGPYLVGTSGGWTGGGGGWLPSAWGQFWNYWQMDYDPLPFPSNSIVEACVWAYIRAIAQLPGHHMRETGNGGTEIVTTSALSRLLRTPNGYETPSDFLVHLIRSLLLNGNSYWVAQRNDRNEVTALHWTNPTECRAREVRIAGQNAAEVFYEIGDNPLVTIEGLLGARTRNLIVPARDVLHFKLATPRHPLYGETWLASLAVELMQRGAINAAITTSAVNMRPAGILTTDLVITKAQADELSERWKEKSAHMAQGGVPVLSAGVKFQPVTMSADDAKTIEQLKLNDRAVAGVFGVPPMLVGLADAGTQKSAEAVMAEWLAAGLGWLINHIEVGFDSFIGLNEVPSGREWTEYDTRALLRSLYKERIDGLVRGVQGGIYSPNEARALEGYAAVKAGAEPRVQQQVVPLSFALEPPTPPASAGAGAPPPAPPPPPPPPEPDEEDGGEPDDEPVDDADDRAFAALQISRRLELKRASNRQAAA